MSQTREVRWFRSKVDWWLAGILMMAAAGATLAAVVAIVTGNGTAAALIGWLGLFALLRGLVFPMRYGIGAGQLVIRHGLVRQRCKLSEIIEVRPTRNPLSSPALSLDRLMVKRGEGAFDSVMVSPADREAFLALLADAAGLARRGDTLRRVGPLGG